MKENKLGQFSNNVFSQAGEDGVLKKIFETIPTTENKWCVEFGAWDGKYLSNCYNLIANFGWNTVMIEASKKKFIDLEKNLKSNPKAHLINSFVDYSGENTLDNILKRTPIPKDFDLLSIDIDGNDYYILESLVEFTPKVIVIEYNPTIPSDIEFVQKKDNKINQGSSLLSIYKLARTKGYELIATTWCNGIFVKKEYFHLFGIVNNDPSVIWDTEIEAPRIFQLYDGTIVVSKDFNLNWNGIKVGRFDLQKLPKFFRHYGDGQKVTKYFTRLKNWLYR